MLELDILVRGIVNATERMKSAGVDGISNELASIFKTVEDYAKNADNKDLYRAMEEAVDALPHWVSLQYR